MPIKSIFFITYLFSFSISVAQDGPTHSKYNLTEHLREIAKSINYPAKAIDKGIEGNVYVSFNLMQSGGLKEIRILNPTSEVLDQEVLRTLKSLNGFWYQPMIVDKVFVNLVIPIEFRILSKKTKEAKEYYQDGLKYLNSGKELKATKSFFEAVRRAPQNEQYVASYASTSYADPSVLEAFSNLDSLTNLDSLKISVRAYRGRNLAMMEPYRVEHFDSDWNRVAGEGVYLRKSNKHLIYGYSGTVLDFYSSEVLLAKSNYQNGKLDGKMNLYFANGRKRLTGWFSDNKPTGRWKFYSEQGQLCLDVKIKNDVVKFLKFKTDDGSLNKSGRFHYDFSNPLDGNHYKLVVPVENGMVNGELKIIINEKEFGSEFFHKGSYIRGVTVDNEILQIRIFMPWMFMPFHFLKLEAQNLN